jgi:hypothetical protein
MRMRSRWGWKIAGGLVLLTALLAGRAAFSGKPAEMGAPAMIAPHPPVVPVLNLCQDAQAFDNVRKLVDDTLATRRWTAKDHERLKPLFHSLRTEQKIEIMRKVGAALDARQLKVDKGTRIF